MLAANLKLTFTAFGQGSFFYEIICVGSIDFDVLIGNLCKNFISLN